ncbi:MAG: methyltransferase domain-containing protein [Anaerolineales bacterium]|nr:methyltransferase domain-containing protein [Anaerolineales bacterium]
MESINPSQLFNAYYYAHDCGQPYQRNEAWIALFNAIAIRIVSDIQPKRVLDAGCALGILVEMLRQRGVEAWGIDISQYAIQNVHPDYQPYCQVGSILESFPHPNYDLIVCIEVLEHLPPQDAEKAIANLCRHSDDILFSSTPYDYKEATHFNVQPPEFWAENFARQGFFHDLDFDATFLTPWAMRFRRVNTSLVRLVHDYERRIMALGKENSDLRNLAIQNRKEVESIEQNLNALEQKIQALQDQIQAAAEQSAQRNHQFEQQAAELATLHRRPEVTWGNRLRRVFRPKP